ncbi:MAG TPA: hypothetical protein VL728_07725 [Cyclobacteriaceae bacterium]|jgi:hypothetical protein|nr:hypothetical protein [Cyclobacteriaceae bacterium]
MKNEKNENPGQKQRSMLMGMFADRESSENAHLTLHDLGYSSDDITLIMSDETRRKYFTDDDSETEMQTDAVQREREDSALDDNNGAIGGIAAAIETSFKLPGEGVLIAGPIAEEVAHARTINKGINGVLVDAGITQAQAKSYESGIRRGQVVIGVYTRSEEDAQEIESSWDSYNGIEIHAN